MIGLDSNTKAFALVLVALLALLQIIISDGERGVGFFLGCLFLILLA